MVRPRARYVISSLPTGNLLIADTCSMPQDMYITFAGEFSKTFAEPVTVEIPSEKLLKHKVSLSPDLEFQVDRFTVSSSTICAVGRRALAVLQPIGDFLCRREHDSATFVFRSFPICRYLFHAKSSIELINVTFVSTERELLSVLSTDSFLRLFDASNVTSESFLAPFRAINLLQPNRFGHFTSSRPSAASVVSSSRISLAKCEPFVSVAFVTDGLVSESSEKDGNNMKDRSFPEVSSFLPFMVLRSNGDVYFGFVDISLQPCVSSPSRASEKAAYDCRLAGPLKIKLPEIDNTDDKTRFYDFNACAMNVVCAANFAKGTPLVIIASSDGSISHYLLMPEFDETEEPTCSMLYPAGSLSSKPSYTLHFPKASLYGIERLRIANNNLSSASSVANWFNDPNCLRISSCPWDGTFSYIVSVSSSVFRISLPWLETAPTASESAFVSQISDDPTFVESLLSIDSQEIGIVSVGHVPSCNAVVVATGSSLFAIPNSAKTTIAQQRQQPLPLDFEDPLFVFPPSLSLADFSSEDVLPPTEDFVAVIQRALARQANLNPKLLANSVPQAKDAGSGSDDQLSKLYTAATGAIAILQQEYFGRTDTAARHLTRLQATCDARFRHVSSTVETQLLKSASLFSSDTLPVLANRIDKLADRLAILVQRLERLSDRAQGVGQAHVLEDVCLKGGFTEQLSDIEVNLAHINSLYGEVDEKASYLATELQSFANSDALKGLAPEQQSPPTSLMPLFDSTGIDIRHIAEDLRRMKDEVDRLDSSHRL